MLTVLAIAMSLGVLVTIGLPLLRGGGQMRDAAPDKAMLWAEEKQRLLDQLRENDLALAEGRIDADSHREIAERLALEAETVVDQLRQSRAAGDSEVETEARRMAWPGSLAALVVIGVATVSAHLVANRSDLDMRVSPHETGQIPIAADDGPPLGPDGAPDIAQMVARLEMRVYDGEPTEDDIQMLLRSYRVLDRGEDALEVLEIASDTFPDNIQFGMMLLRGSLQDPEFEATPALVSTVDRILLAQPDLLEAHWYRGLILARQGQADKARETLTWLRPQLADRPQAAEAVDALLAQLAPLTPPPAKD